MSTANPQQPGEGTPKLSPATHFATSMVAITQAFEDWENDFREDPNSFYTAEEVAAQAVASLSQSRAMALYAYMRQRGNTPLGYHLNIMQGYNPNIVLGDRLLAAIECAAFAQCLVAAEAEIVLGATTREQFAKECMGTGATLALRIQRPQATPETIRAAFEADYLGDGPRASHSLARSGDSYQYMPAQTAWTTWQRAWNAAIAQGGAK